MADDLANYYDQLYSYCKNQGFAGFDPFDGLNSRVFRATPLKHLPFARLAWLQMVKRSSVDLRPALRVEKGVNPKGLALFAMAELSRFRATEDRVHAENARDLIELLLEARITGKTSEGRPTMAFGYNFDWQSRHFFAPVGTPAIVPTAFASQAFMEAYRVFEDEVYLEPAAAICEFILGDLNRTAETSDEICFSYTPGDTGQIFNASLLAGESLARVGAATGEELYLEMAAKTVRFVLRHQRGDGAWVYGTHQTQGWTDNFHTAYVLLSLFRISSLIPDLRAETQPAISAGTAFWLDNFFLSDGTPKYYDKSVYPVDVHSAAVAIAALCELSPVDARMLPMAQRTAGWALENMRDSKGFFYYQVRKSGVVKTPFMRWGQAWMAYALARLIETEGRD